MKRILVGSGVAILATSVWFVQAGSASTRSDDEVSVQAKELQCESGNSAFSQPYLVPPSSEVEAREWAHSAEEAAERVLGSALFDDYDADDLTLERSATWFGPEVPGQELTQFLIVGRDGRTIGFVNVEPLPFGTFAMAQIERCVK